MGARPHSLSLSLFLYLSLSLRHAKRSVRARHSIARCLTCRIALRASCSRPRCSASLDPLVVSPLSLARLYRSCVPPAVNARPDGASVSVCLCVAAATALMSYAATMRAIAPSTKWRAESLSISRSRPCYFPSLDPLVRVQPRVPALAAIMCVCVYVCEKCIVAVTVLVPRMPIWRRYRADAPVMAASASVHLYLCVCACERCRSVVLVRFFGSSGVKPVPTAPAPRPVAHHL